MLSIMTWAPFVSGLLVMFLARRSPLLPDVPTFRELGVDWVDGAYRGIGVPKSTPPAEAEPVAFRKKMSAA